jgi:HEAT repeat protein
MLNPYKKVSLLPVKIVLISLLFLCMACSTNRVVSTNAQKPSLQELLQQEPAINATQAYLINAALMQNGTSGIFKLCLMLNDNDKQVSTQVEYALNSLAMHVTRLGAPKERQEYLQGIYQALEADQLNTRRALLIGLLKIAGDESMLKPLTNFLYNDDLCYLTTATLQNISTPATGKTLLTALPAVSARNKVAIIQALGNLGFLPATHTLFEYVDDPDTAINSAASFALARMGYPPLRTVLMKTIAENRSPARERAVLNYLQWIDHLGDKFQAVQYCREIVANTQDLYADHERITALKILVGILGDAALPDVFNFMDGASEKNQLTALQFLHDMDSKLVIEKVLAMSRELTPSWRSEFVAILGIKKDQTAVPFITTALQDTAAAVQAAALKALLQIQPGNAGAVLWPVMRRDNDSLVLNAVHNGILTVFSQGVLDGLIEHYSEMSLTSKQLVLNILGERQVTKLADFVINQLSAEQAALRITAMQNLPDVAAVNDLPLLIAWLSKIPAREEQTIFLKSILILIGKNKDDPVTFETIQRFSQDGGDSSRACLFPMLKQLGTDPALQILLPEIKSVKAEIKDSAIRTLCDWPRSNALDHLLVLVAGDQDITYRILAARACLRLLQKNDLGKEITFQYYKTIFDSAPRPEEKKMVLAAMAGLKSEKALHFLTVLSKDRDLGADAIAAIQNMVQIAADSTVGMKGADIARAFLSASVPAVQSAGPVLWESDDSLHNRPPDGFVALFNGHDLTGWQGLVADPPGRARMPAQELHQAQVKADQNMQRHWKVIDGVLCFDGQGENLCTVMNYKNFELWIDWKIEKNGDSGIYLRGSPQVQIWDPGSSGIGSGGLYNNQLGVNQPLHLADRPVGEWNTFRIIMHGAKATVYLNDQLVVDNVILENYWERDKPIYATGPIELQAHFNPLYFRNIFIRKPPEEEMPFSGELFNGRDLSGWTIIDGSADSWQVRDSVLYTTGIGGGWLSTKRLFSNFKLELEFRLPPGGNSGIFIRAPQEGDPAYTGMEIQLLDDYAPQYSDLKPWQYTGSIYGVQPPNRRASKPANTWQKIEIDCQGPLIKVTLNGVPIIETNLIEHMDRESTHPGLKRRGGYIGLQNHSTRVEFTRIKIQEY